MFYIQRKIPLTQNVSILRKLWNGAISGHATSIISFLALDKEIVQKLIPQGLLLSEQSITEQSLHPVYFAFNLKQQNVTTPLPFVKLNYAEYAMGIPFLKMKGGNQVNYAFSPVLYLNSILATIGGRLFFSLPKNYAHVDINETDTTRRTFEASQVFNHQNIYLEADFKNDGPEIPAASNNNFLSIKPMLLQPLIVHDSENGFRSTNYTMEGLETTSIQPVTGTCKTGNFLQGLHHQQITLNSINTSVLGSFEISYDWQLTGVKPVK